jgi:hypothetical protein
VSNFYLNTLKLSLPELFPLGLSLTRPFNLFQNFGAILIANPVNRGTVASGPAAAPPLLYVTAFAAVTLSSCRTCASQLHTATRGSFLIQKSDSVLPSSFLPWLLLLSEWRAGCSTWQPASFVALPALPVSLHLTLFHSQVSPSCSLLQSLAGSLKPLSPAHSAFFT